MGGLSTVAQILAALFVLVSGIGSLLVILKVAAALEPVLWATAVLGILGGLAWLAAAASKK